MKQLLIILPLLLIGCAKYELTDAKTEPATVVGTTFCASHTVTTVMPTIDADGQPGVSVDTDHVPADFGVIFRCQHGTFTISGSDDKHAALWKRLSQGDKVIITYQERWRIKGTNRAFDDFVFVDAQKEAKAELDF